MVKKSKSPLVNKREDEKKSGYTLPAEEAGQYGKIVERIIYARNQRELPRDEFDNLSYEQAYLSNRRAAMSYLTPKKNDDEVRINTGTTEKRIELVLNELLAMNLQEEIRAFDKDDTMLQGLGGVFTDLVRRTEEMEDATEKDIYIYKELLTQPSVFVEELWYPGGTLGGKRSIKKTGRCVRRQLQGVQMYLGDLNLPDIRFDEQPYIIKYARMSYEEAEVLFKDMDKQKWQYITPGTYQTIGGADVTLYRRGSLENRDIEVYTYMSNYDDEVQIYVNGIPFLDVGHSYKKEFGDFDGYHMTMVGLNPYAGDFAYSKPLTQSAKTLQALSNETIRNLVRKFRQALEPPMGVIGNRMFNRDIWNPGKIVQGVKRDMFEKLIDHGGVSRGEMAMFDLIEKKTNEFIGTSQQEPLQGKTQVTATELMLADKNAVKLLGLAVLGAMRLKKRLALLRVRNILNNYTKPTGKVLNPITKKIMPVYATFNVGESDIQGQEGVRKIDFTDQPTTPDDKLKMFREEQEAKKRGEPFESKRVNVNRLKELDLHFYAIASAKPRESTELDKTLFREKLGQGFELSQMTGRPLNANKLIDSFERTWKDRGLFQKEAPKPPADVALTAIAAQGGSVKQPQSQQKPQSQAKPSVNTLANQSAKPSNLMQ